MPLPALRILFLVAGLYDFVIGLVFLCWGPALFDWAKIPPPNHWGYLQFAALELVIFGVMFFAIARDPVGNRSLILYGILLKISYISLCGYYWAMGECPPLFKPFAVIDAVMLVLFVVAYLGRGESLSASTARSKAV